MPFEKIPIAQLSWRHPDLGLNSNPNPCNLLGLSTLISRTFMLLLLATSIWGYSEPKLDFLLVLIVILVFGKFIADSPRSRIDLCIAILVFNAIILADIVLEGHYIKRIIFYGTDDMNIPTHSIHNPEAQRKHSSIGETSETNILSLTILKLDCNERTMYLVTINYKQWKVLKNVNRKTHIPKELTSLVKQH